MRHEHRLNDAEFLRDKTDYRLRQSCYSVPRLLSLNSRGRRQHSVKEPGLGRLCVNGEDPEERKREREKARKRRRIKELREYRQRIFGEEEFKPVWERGLVETRWDLIIWNMKRELRESEL